MSNKRCCPNCGQKLPLTVFLIEVKNQFACPGCEQILQIERNQAKLSGVWHGIRCLTMTVMLTVISSILIRIVDMPSWFVMLLCVSIMLAWVYQVYTRSARIIRWHPTCVKCDYNLQGILDSGSGQCPECGHEIQWTNEQFRNKYNEKTRPIRWKQVCMLTVLFIVVSSIISAIASMNWRWVVYEIGWPATYYRPGGYYTSFHMNLSAVNFILDSTIALLIGIVADQIMQHIKPNNRTAA